MPIRDFALDANGDLAVVNGDLAVVGGATAAQNIAAVKQAIAIRVQLFLGEYFLDESQGVDWLGQILGIKNPNRAVVRELIQEAIAATPDVLQVIDGDLVIDAETRTATVAYQVITAYSSNVVDGVVQPSVTQ